MMQKISVIGAGNLGFSIARGLIDSGFISKKELYLVEKDAALSASLNEQGYQVTDNSQTAVDQSNIIIMAVKPYQIEGVLTDIKNQLKADKHILVSCAPGINSHFVFGTLDFQMPFFRVMPNTAMSVQTSMSCITSFNASDDQQKDIDALFSKLGETLFIEESLMDAATVNGGCGTAFALRFIRAMMEGAVEMGFKPDMAQKIAAQTLKGAAELVLQSVKHPEEEIDKVTTPKGITITGLNEMEHQGFSSAVIQGLMKSYKKLNPDQ